MQLPLVHVRVDAAENDDGPTAEAVGPSEKSGGVLLSQGDYPQVPSALTGLTSVFGMGTGVTLSLWPPKSVVNGSPQGLQSKHELFNPSPRPISTGRLNVLPRLHLRPINVMVSSRALLRLPHGNAHLHTGFPLRCFQRLSLP